MRTYMTTLEISKRYFDRRGNRWNAVVEQRKIDREIIEKLTHDARVAGEIDEYTIKVPTNLSDVELLLQIKAEYHLKWMQEDLLYALVNSR
jgi:hypothetical protein